MTLVREDIRPSRLDRAKLLIQSLLEKLAGERVGLVVFSGTAFLQSPLSADYDLPSTVADQLSWLGAAGFSAAGGAVSGTPVWAQAAAPGDLLAEFQRGPMSAIRASRSRKWR